MSLESLDLAARGSHKFLLGLVCLSPHDPDFRYRDTIAKARVTQGTIVSRDRRKKLTAIN